MNAKVRDALPAALQVALLNDELGHKILSAMAQRGELDEVLERVAMRMQGGGPEPDPDAPDQFADGAGDQALPILEGASMDGSMQNMATSNGWEVKLPSREYTTLAPEVRQEIDGYLAEHPVKLGAIAERLGVKVLLSTLPRGTSGRSAKRTETLSSASTATRLSVPSLMITYPLVDLPFSWQDRL